MRISVKNQVKPYISAPKTEQQPPKSGSDSMVEKIVDGTYLSANYAASGLSGGISGLGAFGRSGITQTVKTGASILYNVARTEKLGPTLKTLALVAAVPVTAAAGALTAPISLLAGVWQGAGEVESSTPRQFTVTQASKEAYTEVKGGINNFAGDIQEEMKELGEYKLKPGEKAIEIPLIKLGKTLIMGTIGAAVGGIAGAVSAIGATATEAATGVVGALSDENLNVGQKLFAAGTSVVSAPVHGVIYGGRTALGTIGGALAETWDEDSMTEGAKSILADAKVGVSASVAPEKTLVQEREAS